METTIYSTKFCLTYGIRPYVLTDFYEGVIEIGGKNYDMGVSLPNEGTEWHRSYEDAKVHAEALKIKEIAELEERLKKLKAMEY